MMIADFPCLHQRYQRYLRPILRKSIMPNYTFARQQEQVHEVNLDQIKYPRFGRFLEEFEPGVTFQHPRGLTIPAAFALEFAGTFMQANPLYLNREYALACGFADLLVSPMMVLNVALSLGVQNNSEQAIAHLGYYDVQFLRPVYAGDTLRSQSLVLSRRWRGSKPGIVRVKTTAFNQRDQAVLQYERAILIPTQSPSTHTHTDEVAVSSAETFTVELPQLKPGPRELTGNNTYFEDYKGGDIIVHPNGRTVTDEHMAWSYRLGNTHPLHYDRVYSNARSGAMSGEPIVYGGLVFAWLEGLASRDTSENAIWDLGYTEGYHTQPVVSGDTLYSISRVLGKEVVSAEIDASIMTLQLIGVKNTPGKVALEQNGTVLFDKEMSKSRDHKIANKVFEIERKLVLGEKRT
jgi:2-methylfumaryl-CoA hydratase